MLLGFKRAVEDTEETEKVIPDGIITKEVQNNECLVVLSGKIDANNFEDIQNETLNFINSYELSTLVMDLNEVTYVSSAGLRMFATLHHKTIDRAIAYKLINMRSDIMKLFQMTGYASAFNIEVKPED